MNRFTTQGIILSRTNFGEADRILTFLTPDHGKVKAIAKGARKSKSKLAGGIELFSVSDLTLIVGRGEINTLISSRLVDHYGNLAKEINRANVASSLIRSLNKVTEDNAEAAYYELLKKALMALDNNKIEPDTVKLWFDLQLLKLFGHAPNLKTDVNNKKLDSAKKYNLDLEKMAFADGNRFDANHIKFLRLCLGADSPSLLSRVRGVEEVVQLCLPSVDAMLEAHVRS